MKTKLETIVVAILLTAVLLQANDDAKEWQAIIERMKLSAPPLSEEETIQRATRAFTESTLVRAVRELTGPPMPPPFSAGPALPENARLVSWDIDPSPSALSNGVYVLMYGPSQADVTNYIVTTSGTNSAQIVREPGVRNYWAVVAVSDEGVMSEKLFNEHRLPLAFEQQYIALVSDTFSGPRRPVVTNTVTSPDPIRFLWGEGISTIIP